MTDETRMAHQAKSGVNRRQFVVQTTCAAGIAGVFSVVAPSLASAIGEMPLSAAPKAAPKPVAYVWMGQIFLDPTGREKPYVSYCALRS
jgi:hypothetical protein